MRVEPYRSCQACGRSLETTTQFLRQAYCADCGTSMAVR